MKLQVAPKGYPHFHSLSIFSTPSKKVWMTASKNSESEYQPSFFSCFSCRKRNLKDSSISSRAFSPFIKSNIAFCLNDDAKIIIFWWFTKLFKEKNHLLIIFTPPWFKERQQKGKEVRFPTKHRVPFRFACEIDFVSKTEWGSRRANNGTKKQPRKAAFLTPCIIQKWAFVQFPKSWTWYGHA